jgi:signal peptidase I
VKRIRAFLKKVCVGSNWRHTVVRAVVLSALAYGVCTTIFLPLRIQGDSMLPLYETGDYGFINTLAYHWSDPQRFDVVAIRMAGKSVMYLKRIIGLPGETVEIRDGTVHVNGAALSEPYLQFKGDWELRKQSLSGDQYFVVGDNRGMFILHHTFGKVKRHRIVGKAWLLKIPSL